MSDWGFVVLLGRSSVGSWLIAGIMEKELKCIINKTRAS
jgi:hypothetical protein